MKEKNQKQELPVTGEEVAEQCHEKELENIRKEAKCPTNCLRLQHLPS